MSETQQQEENEIDQEQQNTIDLDKKRRNEKRIDIENILVQVDKISKGIDELYRMPVTQIQNDPVIKNAIKCMEKKIDVIIIRIMKISNE